MALRAVQKELERVRSALKQSLHSPRPSVSAPSGSGAVDSSMQEEAQLRQRQQAAKLEAALRQATADYQMLLRGELLQPCARP